MTQLFGFAGDENMPKYRAAITREYPFWIAVLTGGDMPEAGHVMTSLSLARLRADIDDWLTWHHGMDDFTPAYDVDEDDLDEDAYHYVPGDENDDDDPEPELGFGWGVTWDYAFPQAAKDASERYWEAMKALRPAWDTLCQAVWTIHGELKASPADIGRYLFLPEKRVQRILQRHQMMDQTEARADPGEE
jgi:hypothetical protein